MNTSQSKTTDDLLVRLAELEHEQWMHWSQAVAGEVPESTRAKWKSMWIPYSELTEELREHDRVWARKVLELLRCRGLIR